ncbi:MAG: class I SAM-dependent methyltransferase [Desulfatibacillaceae bacterium]|nr:class I SAM-dependent methyltransferase [Desulfatibacillaceae bacterium]
MRSLTCRFCHSSLAHSLVDLGASPLSNSYLSPDDLGRMEPFYPLHARVCSKCFLVQVESFESPESIFSDYAYFSSYSDSWLAHCRNYAKNMVSGLMLGPKSLVMEVAANDGYLLQYFLDEGVPVVGIEPAANVAEAARKKGIETVVDFFGLSLAEKLAGENRKADLVIANNVLAHVPDINDFVAGLAAILKENGTLTLEFPHLLELMENCQFDTIYHEHFSYFSLMAVNKIFAAHGLYVFDVERLPTHGGSLRIHACHAGRNRPLGNGFGQVMAAEEAAGLDEIATYGLFEAKVHKIKREILSFLIEAKNKGQTVVGYGAPAKGNTLLNYLGVRGDFLDYTVDKSPHKQGLYLPGTRIPIYAPEKIFDTRPDFVFILPWNLSDEIVGQMGAIRQWGGRFVVPIPKVRVIQ